MTDTADHDVTEAPEEDLIVLPAAGPRLADR